MKMMFLHRYVKKGIKSAHPSQIISKQRLFFNLILYQNTLVNIWLETAEILQILAGEIFLVVCYLRGYL